MEKILKINNLSFKYPENNAPSLKNISLEINRGEIVILAGKSASSKTTLLKNIKAELCPHGERSGEILFDGTLLDDIPPKERVSKIGLVMQNPEDSIVCDTVLGEIAFGLESLAYDSESIRQIVSEVCEYLGISHLIGRKTDTLSGGEKQLVSLAGVLSMYPDLLMLDEPLSQLDSVAADSFAQLIKRLNTEQNLTIIISEHRLERLLPYGDRLIILDNGEIAFNSTPQEFADSFLPCRKDYDFLSPPAVRIFNKSEAIGKCPLTVRDCAQWLRESYSGAKYTKITPDKPLPTEKAMEIKDVFFAYEKKSKMLFDNLCATVNKGTITALLGGNGVGKSTFLQLLCGVLKPYSGKIKIYGKKVAYMPQNAYSLFTEKTVKEDLLTVSDKIEEAVNITEIENILNKHPNDLSGGEIQKAALAKLLLLEPDILLLDEITKGLDGAYKAKLGEILTCLAAKGVTVLCVSHDVEFCAEYAQKCMLLSGGKIVSEKTKRDFFKDNRFFTSCARIISRGVFEDAVTDSEVASLCKKNGH